MLWGASSGPGLGLGVIMGRGAGKEQGRKRATIKVAGRCLRREVADGVCAIWRLVCTVQTFRGP